MLKDTYGFLSHFQGYVDDVCNGNWDEWDHHFHTIYIRFIYRPFIETRIR